MLPLALLVVDRAMRVLWANARARRVLVIGDPLAIEGERLVVHANALAEIELVLSSVESGDEAAVAIGRTSRPGALFTRATRLAGVKDAILLQLADRDELPAISPAIVRQLFGLTAVEAKLAALVAQSAPLGRAAATLRISAGTARNHLKSIFRKTSVRRQSDLVSLLLAMSVAWEPHA